VSRSKPILSLGKKVLEQEKSAGSLFLDVSSANRNISCYLPSSSVPSNEKVSALSRKVFALDRQVRSLTWSKKVLEEQIE
jgi:Rad3-related DNA helicase